MDMMTCYMLITIPITATLGIYYGIRRLSCLVDTLGFTGRDIVSAGCFMIWWFMGSCFMCFFTMLLDLMTCSVDYDWSCWTCSTNGVGNCDDLYSIFIYWVCYYRRMVCLKTPGEKKKNEPDYFRSTVPRYGVFLSYVLLHRSVYNEDFPAKPIPSQSLA